MSIDAELLQRYYDGELSEAEALQVRTALQKDKILQQELAQFQAIGDLLREYGQQSVDAASFDGVLESLTRDEPQKVLAPRVRASWWKELFAPSMPRWWMPAGALAFAVFLFVLVRHNLVPDQAMDTREVATAPSSVQTQQTPAEADAAGAAEARSEVVEVDFGENSGTVMDIEAAPGQHIAVLWVEEPEAGKVNEL